MTRPIRAFVIACLPLLAFTGHSQMATPAQMAGVTPDPNFGVLHMQTHLGSFRLIDGRGRVEFTFEGTVLISKLKGTWKLDGAARKEYEGHDRLVLNGRGKMTVTGEWRAIQWFGTNMKGVWYGFGTARLQGEFDRNLNTGTYWFEDTKDVRYWLANNVIDVTVPTRKMGTNPNAVPKKKGG
ncbi:MAG: hypothetical protein IT207_11470 [Fimbriimonadaceae bacterium]|nr:hypothetical protein [Fimbriimonadaceae bacterium]